VGVVDDGGEHLASGVEAAGLGDEAALAAHVVPLGFDLKRLAQDAGRAVVGVQGAVDDRRHETLGVEFAERALEHALAGAGLTHDEAEASLLAVHADDVEHLLLVGHKCDVFRRKPAACSGSLLRAAPAPPRGALSGWAHCPAPRPARPHAGRLGRRWRRPSRGLTPTACERNRCQMPGCSRPLLPSARGAKLPEMQPLKAHVKNGRVVLDEPLELPEDTELEVGSLHVVDTGDDFDDEERERLHRALDAAIESVQAGRTVDGNEVIRRLLSRP
jgi:hypothetical protein